MEWLAVAAYLFGLVLLVVTLVFGCGAGTAASVKGWLTIGGVRSGQPAELAKPLTVLACSPAGAVLRREEPKSLSILWKPLLVVGVPWLLIMAQPTSGSGLAFFGILFAMLFWAGIPWPMLVLLASPAVSLVLSFSAGLWGAWFVMLGLLVFYYKPFLAEGVALMVANVMTGVAAPLIWDKLKPYQQKRLLVFLDPQNDPKASGYHVLQSQVAIGSGACSARGGRRERRSASRSFLRSTPTSSGRWSARSWASSACRPGSPSSSRCSCGARASGRGPPTRSGRSSPSGSWRAGSCT
jgi:rod shape determining protein RodA